MDNTEKLLCYISSIREAFQSSADPLSKMWVQRGPKRSYLNSPSYTVSTILIQKLSLKSDSKIWEYFEVLKYYYSKTVFINPIQLLQSLQEICSLGMYYHNTPTEICTPCTGVLHIVYYKENYGEAVKRVF